MKLNKATINWLLPALVIGVAIGGKITGCCMGDKLFTNLWMYLKTLLLLLPPVFVLIGLFEVWVPQTVIEKHFGESHGFGAWFWLMMLGATIVGGLYVALPLGYALYQKGTHLRLIYGFLGFSTICRIPMTFFEASFLGLKFTIIRYLVSLPLAIISSIILERLVSPPPDVSL